MPSSRTFLALAIALLVVTAMGSTQTWAMITFLFAFVAFIAAILARPRERRARLVASLATFGSDWTTDIGPPPESGGRAIPADPTPARFMRAYPGRDEFEIRTRRAADQAALAPRGYVAIGESFVEGRWRTTDWLGALVFLFPFVIVGIVILIYMAGNKPGGTLTVTYERQSAGGTGVAGPSQAEDPERRPVQRLRSLDDLRDQGLIGVDEWTTRRRMILAEI